MIQRIQSIYLVITVIAGILLFIFPLADYYNELEGNYKFFLYGIRSMDPQPQTFFSSFFTIPLILLNVISIALSLITIFMFRKRSLQLRLCAFNVLANIVLLMVIFFFYVPRITEQTHVDPEYNILGMMLPLITLAFLVMATRAIKKDEALVKSTDRLR